MKKVRKIEFAILILTGIGIVLFLEGFYIKLKAITAQHLIEAAWKKSVQTQTPQKPWAWADTKVIMKLYIPKLDKELYVLKGDSGESLAFGPAHSTSSFYPGQNGTVMISAHRDTHFTFLKDMKVKDEVIVEDIYNTKYIYTITDSKIIDANKDRLPIKKGVDELLLLTCYPFDTVKSGGSLRYVMRGVYN